MADPTQDNAQSITVIVPSGTQARFTTFELNLMQTLVSAPKGSRLARARGSSPAKNRNEPIRLSVTPWYLFMDDDQKLTDDFVYALMKHDKPVVASLVCQKEPPHAPIIFKDYRLDPMVGKKRFEPYSWADLDRKVGLFGPVYAANGGVFLVKREVFEKIPDPWFAIGQYNPEECNEDLYFYEQCRKAGIDVYVDLSTPSGHIGPVASWPHQLQDGTWTIRLEFENEQSVLLGRTDIKSKIQNVVPLKGVSER